MKTEENYLRVFVRAYKKNVNSRSIAFALSEEEFFKLVQGDYYWCYVREQIIKPDSRASKEHTLISGIRVPTNGVDHFNNDRDIPLRIRYLAAPPAAKSKELSHYQTSLISALLSAEGIPSSEDRSKACLHPTTGCSGDGDEREG